jgi:hypothetical protein
MRLSQVSGILPLWGEDEMTKPIYTGEDAQPPRHAVTGKPIGSWVRGQGFRWWKGGCPCGSGLPGHEDYDGQASAYYVTCEDCIPSISGGI